MARMPAVRPQSARVTDQIHLGAIGKFFPPDVVEQVLTETERHSQRRRHLPAPVMVYYVIAMSLWMEVSCSEVLRCLLEGLSRIGLGVQRVRCTTRSAISMARDRLGAAPLRRLLETCVKPIATARTRGAWYRGWRVVSLDGSTLDVADTEANEATFGRPGVSRGDGAFPKLRFVSLVENGTHVLFATAWGAFREGEVSLAERVVAGLRPGMLCLADRGFFGFSLWTRALATGADLVWRTKKNLILPCEERLSDGSYLSQVFASPRDRRHRSGGRRVRVIEYELEGAEGGARYRLITTILDEHRAPATDLAQLYHERWEIENTFDELKTHLRGRQIVLRSQKPELVEQEFCGLLLAHYAIRGLMHEAAHKADVDPDRLSFVHSLRVVRRKLPTFAALPPSGAPQAP